MAPKQNGGLRIRATTHPIVYEVNVRILLTELSVRAGKKLNLDQIPDALLDEWAALGFDAVWMMGVWTSGKLGIQIARTSEHLRQEYGKVLPDFKDDDVAGSPYAVGAYRVPPSLGGKTALQSLRKKLAQRGMALILDFVCNHTARDHAWVLSHPEYYVNGREGEEVTSPDRYFRVKTKKGDRTIAFGRDPHFPGWTDTAQLNPHHAGAREAMIETLQRIAEQCDGVRCDMAMLLLRDVFQNTWGEHAAPLNGESAEGEFWHDAITEVRRSHSGFLFIAEVYWNLEWPLQQLGFDYTYDKVLYERLLREGATSVRDHLKAEQRYQQHSARFVENHDEPRIAQILPSEAWQYAAATVASTVPGMLLMHEGQLEGRRVKVPVQLRRRPAEEPSPLTKTFYTRLLSCLSSEVIRMGEWKLLGVRSAWHDNFTYQNILAYSWRKKGNCRLIIVNYAPLSSQCYVDLDLETMEGSSFEFRDMMSTAIYIRDRVGLQHKGMYFDLPGYGLHIFDLTAAR